MNKSITIIQGHPDPGDRHFCHALATAYSEGATATGHDVRFIEAGRLDFPWLKTKADFEHGAPCATIKDAQALILGADHLVIIYPLWLGEMPAILKAFFEQVLRPGFAFDSGKGFGSQQLLRGRSARIVVTMGMPAFIYRWYFGAHGLKSLRRNILGFCGIGPIATDLIGNIDGDASMRGAWLSRMRTYGSRGV
jgi:putative NADPH-quinone reductase